MHASLTSRSYSIFIVPVLSMTIGKVTIPLLVKRSDLVAQLVNLTSVCIKKNVCTEKKYIFNKGRKTGTKGVQKERRRNVKGGTSHSLTCPPPLPTFEKQNSDAKNSIGYCGLTPAIYLLLYGPVLRKRRVYPKKYKRDCVYDKISCRIKLAQNSL